MSDQNEWDKHHATLPDGGPLYAETNIEHFFVEPWNSISSLTFLVPAIWWMTKIGWNVKKYPFFTLCAFMLSLGGLGSATFHGFRYSSFFIMMDVLPIVVLNVLVSLYFWHKLLGSYWRLALVFVVMVIARGGLFVLPLSNHDRINVSYFIAGVFIFLPLLILLIKTKWQQVGWVVLGLISLALALVFRKIDAFEPPLMAIGTHWLWHVFCALGAFFVGKYLLFINQRNVVGKLE